MIKKSSGKMQPRRIEKMSRQVVFLRVGADFGSGGIQSPLFEDGTFEMLCIPDGTTGDHDRTYGARTDRRGRPLTVYFGKNFANKGIHIDPEFETMTYGDPTQNKRGLRKLCPGDYLVFTCGLQRWSDAGGWDKSDQPHIYIAGYFVVEKVGFATEFEDEVLRAEFSQNDHVFDSQKFQRQKEKLLLVKGGPGSRTLKRAVRISEIGNDVAGKPLKVLSGEMRQHFGEFGGSNSVQRSTPRWVCAEKVESAIRFLSSQL